jgi:peptidyl-dipeptidase Dcp
VNHSVDLDAAVERLLAPWPGPYGGLPPFDQASPAAIERAMRHAIEGKRAEVLAISSSPEPATFANTVEALEDSGRVLRRVEVLFDAFNSGASSEEMRSVQQRIAPLRAALDDAVMHDTSLFRRVDTLHVRRGALGLDHEQRRLLEVLHARFVRAGAGLAAADQQRLEAINTRLAQLSAAFGQNIAADGEHDQVVIDDLRELDGVPVAHVQEFSKLARARGLDGRWVIPNSRPQVWAVLTHGTNRKLRERAWRMWNDRGDHPGAHDNKPLLRELLALRGEKARLLGYASYAHYMLDDRMVRSPDAALGLLERAWTHVARVTGQQVAAYQAIAAAEAAPTPLAPWDRQFYAEKLRRSRFQVDGDEVRQYLVLDRILDALFWLAGRVHGLTFHRLDDVPVLHPDVRVYAVDRHGEPFGVLYFDLFQRPDKMHGSYQAQYRAAERGHERVLPVSAVVSGLPPPADGVPTLLPWEYANVLFHEFGHALHILSSRARYASLGSLGVAWDFIELPSLLNERWLRDRDLLRRYARHHATGVPMPDTLIENLERAATFERVFSVNLDYLAPAIFDMRVHMLATGAPGQQVDAARLERELCLELEMPTCWDMIMRATSNWHSFVGAYAAGLYSYLWADILAADVTEAFTSAPGGLYDEALARRWRESILSVGNTVPADAAFRNFRGRDPDPDALLRRYNLLDSAATA